MKKLIPSLTLLALLAAACSTPPISDTGPVILASHSILADVAREIAGNTVAIEPIIPDGVDTHSYQPTPQDIARISNADLVITNGFGLEPWMQTVIQEEGFSGTVVEATSGLQPMMETQDETDPHFWMDPILMMQAASNIEKGLSSLLPENKDLYASNLGAYTAELKSLDEWIRQVVSEIPIEHRLIVTNHHTLGYFAQQYGFTVAGTILEGTSSESGLSSKHLQDLINLIIAMEIPVIFIEPTDDANIAEQIKEETGVRIETGLNTHSLKINGTQISYLEMVKQDVELLRSLGE